MHFSRPDADILLRPGSGTVQQALGRVTHLCIAAHQDDIEIMAQSAIEACRADAALVFGGVVVTDGAGSARSGAYSKFSDAHMREVRREEQRKAAHLGGYEVMIQLAYPSTSIRPPAHATVISDLSSILSTCRPQVLLTHNPADKHDTHVAVLLRCIEALQALPRPRRPERMLGCEVWRSLDWLDDAHKVALANSGDPDLSRRLLACFDSQIAGGKRYDLAVPGRRLANSTFHQSHHVDASTGITWAMDLSPLLEDDAPSVSALVDAEIERFRSDVALRLARLS